MFKNQVFLKQCKARCFTPPPVGNRSKPTGLVLALVAAFVLFSACRSGNNSEEIIEIIDGANEPPAVPTVTITVGGDYEGAIKVNYAEKSTSTNTKTISGNVADSGIVQLASYPPRGALVVSIQAGADTNPPIYIGRLIGSSVISLKLKLNNLGNLELRPADSGKIPIGTYSEFQLIRADAGTLSGSYIQEADIDLMGDSGLGVPAWEPVGTSSAAFTGNYDGDGKLIKRLYIDKGGIDNVGLFGYAAGNAGLANIHIASGSVTGKDNVGGLLGCASLSNTGTISGCSNSAAVTGASYIGGVMGSSGGFDIPAISDCYNTGEIKGSGERVGGVAGYVSANMTNCYNSGKIENSGKYTGGVAGYASITMLACYNTGDVKGSNDSATGGVAGYTNGTILACYNSGGVKGVRQTGGVVGRLDGVTTTAAMTACYNIGRVEGGTEYTGGVIGSSSGASMTACYNTGSVSSVETSTQYIGSLFGYGSSVTACYWQTGTADSPNGRPNPTGCTEFAEADFFAPSTSDSAQWGTGQGTASGTYWKDGTTNGSMLPQLWYEK